MREELEAAIDNEVLASHSSEKWAFHEYTPYRFNRCAGHQQTLKNAIKLSQAIDTSYCSTIDAIEL